MRVQAREAAETRLVSERVHVGSVGVHEFIAPGAHWVRIEAWGPEWLLMTSESPSADQKRGVVEIIPVYLGVAGGRRVLRSWGYRTPAGVADMYPALPFVIRSAREAGVERVMDPEFRL